jgi:hypothetical protein
MATYAQHKPREARTDGDILSVRLSGNNSSVMNGESSTEVRIESKGKQPMVCPTDPAELAQCDSCQ